MIVTPENSMKIYREMAANPITAPHVTVKTQHDDPYRVNGKDQVSIVRSENRREGIREAVRLIGDMSHLTKGVKRGILIKPNCNTDDPYPRDTHHETVRTIAGLLIETGVKPEQITVGDMSGRARGLPTRTTMENLGITKVAEELGLNISYFEEEEWVTLKPEKAKWWPKGIKIPKTVYEAERIIFTPILRSHSTATFTCSLKLGVGLIDAEEREWLHNGKDFYEKMMDINLAYQVDMVIADAMRMNTGYGTDRIDEVQSGIITASNSMMASDIVSAAIMQSYKTVRVTEYATRDQTQFKLGEKLGLGKTSLSHLNLKALNLVNDESFDELMDFIKTELR